VNRVWLRVGHRHRFFHHAKGRIRTSAQDRLGRSQAEQIAGEQKFDSQ
jgi:hypothetical protein